MSGITDVEVCSFAYEGKLDLLKQKAVEDKNVLTAVDQVIQQLEQRLQFH